MATMTTVRRIQAAAAFSAAVFAATCWQIGDAVSRHRPASVLSRGVSPAAERNAASFDSTGMFASRPVITYTAPAGSYFAWQLKPALGDATARPRDLVVAIDIAATKAGLPLQQARQLTEELIKRAGREDRVVIWTVNTPEETRDLTKGFRTPADARVTDALTNLEKTIYAAGATDLKAGLKKIVSGLSTNDARRTAIVYLGDGNSWLNEISDAERNRIAADMADRQISMFTVPLGPSINAKTVHGLANATGGMVIRMASADQVGDIAGRMLKCIDAPVLYPTKTEFTNAVVEAMPTRLPPLRGDSPTLVAGQFRKGDAVECRVEGFVAGKQVAMVLKDQLPETDGNNFFLMNLVKQWGDADRSAPAVMRADRGLALSFEQTRLARDEFLTQAHWALGMDKLDAAEHLFQTANAMDPQDSEAAAGAKIAQRLRSGEITKQQLNKEVQAMGGRVEVVKAAATELTQDAAVRPGAEPATGAQLLELEKRRRAVQEQALTQLIDDSVRQARQLVKTDPDSAYDLLKRQLGSVRDNGDLSDGVRSTLANRLESALRTIQADGARVKLEQDTELRRRIALEAARGAENVRIADEERIRERVRLFGSLMDRARYEEAYKESLELQRELTAKGRAIPPSVHATYVMNTNAANIRDYEELRRVKEERFLLTMLQVDKSHIPFPDEPPVAYPPAAYWKEITEMRKDRYSSDGLGGFSRKATELRDKLALPISINRSFDGLPLKDVLEYFADQYSITFLINPIPFKDAGDEKVEDKPVRIPKMPGVSLSTILSYALSQVNATYLIRKDYVEITTRKAAGYEKTVRAYPVADLVIPIPSAVDQFSLQQNLQVLGASLSANGQAIFGAAGGGLNLGNFGQLGGIQQFGGGFGGALGGIGGGGGGQAFLGGGAGGFQGGALGFAGGTQQNNLGFGGGALGFGGGQQGQFGNLGGQFGFQGGDTSNILIKLIEDTIAPREWNTTAAKYVFANAGQTQDDDLPPLDIALLNSMGYYQPARALVVRGSARVHSRVGDFTAPSAPGGAGAANPLNRGDDAFVVGPKNKLAPAQPAVAKKPEPVAKEEPAVAKNVDRDPKKVWNDAMAQGHFKPRNVIAVGEVMMACAKFDEAAEVLKADLRHGILAHPCVFDALAVALQGSGASIEEIERVKLSKIDLDPKNPQNYLDVAAAVAELGRQDKALEYCKRAAALEPNTPEAYHKTLVIIGSGEKPHADAVTWAASNLLQRDWGTESSLYHEQAKSAINKVATQLDKAGRAADAAQVRAIATKNGERDLVIESKWAEQADVDMSVAEPAGTICAARTPRTPAGGLWTGDNLAVNAESYVAAQAFNGSYEVTVRRIWGRPLADKVSVRVIKHQGADNESVELHTLVLDAKGEAKLKVNMSEGRREQLDSVPVAATVKRLPVTRQTPDEINNLLRSMADPMLAISRPGMTAGSSAGGTMTDAARANLGMEPGVELSHQTKVSPALSSGVDLLTKTTISGDRSTMKISLAPAFDAKTVNPRVPLAAVPGGN
jgi:tetratricopeptide (TPR) repeat protein